MPGVLGWIVDVLHIRRQQQITVDMLQHVRGGKPPVDQQQPGRRKRDQFARPVSAAWLIQPSCWKRFFSTSAISVTVDFTLPSIPLRPVSSS